MGPQAFQYKSLENSYRQRTAGAFLEIHKTRGNGP